MVNGLWGNVFSAKCVSDCRYRLKYENTIHAQTACQHQHHGPTAVSQRPQVAEITGLSEKTINRRIHDGSLPAKRLGPRVFRIHRDSLLAWLGAS
jgi:excisionase family DNA binding protein